MLSEQVRMKQKIQIVLVVAIAVAATRTGYIFYQRHAEKIAEAENQPPPLNPDYYVIPKKLYPYDLKSARQLTQQPVWVKEGYRYSYFDFDLKRHRTDFFVLEEYWHTVQSAIARKCWTIGTLACSGTTLSSIPLGDPTVVPVGSFVSSRFLPLRECHLLHRDFLPWHHGKQMRNAIQSRPLFIVGLNAMPGRLLGVGGCKHRIACT